MVHDATKLRITSSYKRHPLRPAASCRPHKGDCKRLIPIIPIPVYLMGEVVSQRQLQRNIFWQRQPDNQESLKPLRKIDSIHLGHCRAIHPLVSLQSPNRLKDSNGGNLKRGSQWSQNFGFTRTVWGLLILSFIIHIIHISSLSWVSSLWLPLVFAHMAL